MSKQTYDNQAISALKGAERVRKRPGVIFGSDGLEGCQHAVFEILSNSIDEAREGRGKVIAVTRFEDHSIEVEDAGSGCPVDYNEKEGRYNWELVFCELYAGGKYHNAEGGSYEYSLGLNGLGSCATQYASEYMDVTVWRDMQEYTLRFERGENVGGLQSKPLERKKTGTRIRWKPDLDVFTDIAVSAEYFADMLKRQAVVNSGVTFRFRNQVGGKFETTDFIYTNGIADYIAELVGQTDEEPGEKLNPISFWQTERKGRDRADKPEYKVKLSCAFCFSQTISHIEHYHNSSWLAHGGSPDKALRSAFVSALDGFCKQEGKYTKNESKITFQDVADCLVFVSNNFSTATSYENQTKKAINNKFIQEAMTDFLKQNWEIYCLENKQDALRIADQVLINKRSRERAEETRLGIKKKLSGGLDIQNRVQKFVDCRSRDVSQRELYIVEGDSALGACKMARDADFQAIMPIRGKILNCLKEDYAKIFKSEIITDLLKVLGCGVEIKSKQKDLPTFDLGALRWGKVIICTDADVDGFHIRTMVLAMLYRLVPTLINEGLVYIALSPLFEINTKDKTLFAYSDEDLTEILKDIGNQKYTIQRSKGLGENEPDMMNLTTMNPATRRLIRVMPEEAEAMANVFDLLLGKNLAGRKEHIAQYGGQYLAEIEVS
ncbi:MAG: toprim domain-containing protein [Oscillospiraceae bacterium]|nr:toprim domain-containing protein [Oscillospiraceae bacterium]